MKGRLHLTLNTVSRWSDSPSPTTLSWVWRFHNLFHALTSLELISHTFSKSQTPKRFGVVGFVSKSDIKIASSIKRNRLAVAFDCILLAYCHLSLPPNVKLFLSRWPPTKHRNYKFLNLTHKINHDVYCFSFKVIRDFQYP